MRCPNCSTELPESAKFCLECGSDLRGRGEYASPAAYTPRHLAERILTTRAALEGERKQVTVLFCDIANSTALAERVGPERMHGLLNGFFELALGEVHRYEGTINQFLGDGFMALFGAPLAHEDDARRAVLAALQIRRTLKDRASYAGLGGGAELVVRIGLNTGLVVGRLHRRQPAIGLHRGGRHDQRRRPPAAGRRARRDPRLREHRPPRPRRGASGPGGRPDRQGPSAPSAGGWR